MAKTKVWVNGELISAALINTNLAGDIPPTATTLYGSSDLTLLDTANYQHGARQMRVTRSGLVVHMSGTFQAKTNNHLSGTFRNLYTLPAQFRPERELVYTSYQDNNVFVQCVIQTTGNCAFWTVGSAASPVNAVTHVNVTWNVAP